MIYEEAPSYLISASDPSNGGGSLPMNNSSEVADLSTMEDLLRPLDDRLVWIIAPAHSGHLIDPADLGHILMPQCH